ncbi:MULTISPECIES: MraY family glycosyltransferase [unclassified Streptomyces]|uniref:MraY family glycosyltransferase n=1 Tax=unclassified Streptomyces TaxID=2593676 RepID=UPI001F035970|nr:MULTISPECIES: MraY family glycosyltransferase [unclassified Streptomyces]MCH0562931.1 undecaprenyl/decaprenyl-phosphate alpha-N-acetylglucosaminyl 1-phosphate transferase [Streptomyces sp. MUM 2J]MCH0571664.1 undecaprenyl/decaprenyl-phosphate alpha-N-acetylglucosaminyl 1-phosphate transferase [Streptomyces sp. MUM 136J]
MLYGIAAATAALVLSAALAALLRVPALRLGVTARRGRARPLPLLGGAAVVLATCLVSVAGHLGGVARLGEGIGSLLVAGTALAALGLAADVWRLRVRFLAAGTAVAAACVVPFGETGPVGGLLAVGWVVCATLAFRSLDHADALAGTVGAVTAFGAGACAAVEVRDGLAVLLSVLAAALIGFLMHNWPPARTGLGACGALFTGFVLASAAVLTRTGYGPAPTAGVLFSLAALGVADVVLVVVSRRRAGRPLLQSGPDHLAHRLRRLGVAPRGVVVLLGAGASGGVLAGVLVHCGWVGAGAAFWVAGGVLAVVGGLLRVKPYGPRRQPRVPAPAASPQVEAPLRVRNG